MTKAIAGKKTKWIDNLKKVGKFYHYLFESNGKKHHGSTKCQTRDAAERWLKHYRDEVENRGIGNQSVTTLGALLALWEIDVSTVRKIKQVKIDVRQIQKHFGHLLNRPVDRITHDDIQDVIGEYLGSVGHSPAKNGKLIERPHTSGGVKSLVSRLDAVMNFGVRIGMIARIPYWVRKPKVLPKGRPIISAKQVLKFLEVVDQARNPHVRLAVRLMVGLGIREGECLASQVEWFDMDQGIYLGQGKTSVATAIPIPQWLIEYLKGQPSLPSKGLLMPSGKVDKHGQALPHSAQFTQKIIRRAGKALGVPRLSPHGLRASFATLHHNTVGSSVSETQQLMAHTQASTTMKHYIQRVDASLKAQQEKAAEAMGLAAPKDESSRIQELFSQLLPLLASADPALKGPIQQALESFQAAKGLTAP